jgi:hypothetical protein
LFFVLLDQSSPATPGSQSDGSVAIGFMFFIAFMIFM